MNLLTLISSAKIKAESYKILKADSDLSQMIGMAEGFAQTVH